MFESSGLYTPIPFGIGHNAPLHFKFTLHGIGRRVFKYVQLMVVRIAIIGSIINIPFIIYIMNLRCPEVTTIGRIFRTPHHFTNRVSHIGNVRRFPKQDFIFCPMCIIILAIMEQSTRIGSFRKQRIYICILCCTYRPLFLSAVLVSTTGAEE